MMDHYGVALLPEVDLPLANIDGLPDAKHFVELDGHLTKQIAHLALQKADLDFVLEMLRQINLVEVQAVQEALWELAIIRFIKCFVGGSARIQLDENAVLGNEPGAMAAFKFFKNIRNKHFVHDENSYTQCMPAAAINDGRKAFKIEKIIAVRSTGITLDQPSYANLELAARQSLEWTIAKFDALCARLTTELENETMEELLRRPKVLIRPPNIVDIGSRRAKP
jgi:hypothetical protein